MNIQKKLLSLSAVVAFSASVLSCIKAPIGDDNEAPATAAEVTGKIAEAWGVVDPLTMKVNDFTYYETEQKVETGDAKVVLQEGTTISKKVDNTAENTFDYSFLYQFTPVQNGQGQQSTKEDHRSVDKPVAAAESVSISSIIASATDFQKSNLELNNFSPKALTPKNAVTVMADDYQMSLGFEKLISLAYACHPSDTLQQYCQESLGADSCEIKCGNLTAENSVIPAPPLMANQNNCAGLPNCQLHLKKVDFDWSIVIRKGEQTQKQKIHYSITVAEELPFFSRVYENCLRGLVTANDGVTKALVHQCWKLRNYVPGH